KTILPSTTDNLGSARLGAGEGNRSAYSLIIQPDRTDSIRVKIVYPNNGRITEADSGVLPYIDSLWYIRSMSKKFQGFYLIQTAQADYDCERSKNLEIELKQSAWMYFAI